MVIDKNFDFEKYAIGVEELKEAGTRKVKKQNTNPFPVDVFPLTVQQIITSTNESLNFPIDFISASLIYAASISIGNTHRLQVKRGYQTSAVIYLAIVARAGTNKSHPLSWALQPIIEQDKKEYKEFAQQKSI